MGGSQREAPALSVGRALIVVQAASLRSTDHDRLIYKSFRYRRTPMTIQIDATAKYAATHWNCVAKLTPYSNPTPVTHGPIADPKTMTALAIALISPRCRVP